MTLSMVATLTSLDVPAEPDLESRLVEASRHGDRDAFGDLVRLHERRVFRLAGRFFRAREDVEEAAQETFLTAWARLATYRAEAPFEHWLTRICLNACYQRLRRTRPTEELPESLPTSAEADADVRIEVERLLATLPAKDRFLLLMLYGEEWSVAEIADKLGWSKANVKVRAHRARGRLRKLLEESMP
ncbi:MAG: RNA polymerase sigma factor [Thermoanaerobaculia bacterium]